MPPLSNPYIVGNPIKTREMFFGREDDFQFVARKVGEGRSNQIVVLCGERRSGKTSILFQIMGGRLGRGFLPVLIDMQMLAGTKGDLEFFRAILRSGYAALEGLDPRAHPAPALLEGGRVEQLVEAFLTTVQEKVSGRSVLFLLDEYELIEAKIKDGTLSESTVFYLAGVLESAFPASFVFTGSTNLEDRNPAIWRTLLGKSVYRKISYLSHRDTVRLITEPLKDCVNYPEEVVESVVRLTGGQPFYTQVVCQNLVDLLIEEGRADPSGEDVERIVREIVTNPLPQMIYSWNSFSTWSRIALSALAGTLGEPSDWADVRHVLRFLRNSRILAPFGRERGNVLLEEAYHRELLEKDDAGRYRFRMDIFRRWIRREHSIWKVVKEADVGFRRAVRPFVFPLWIGLGAAACLVAAWLFLVPVLFPGLGAWGRSVGLLPADGRALSAEETRGEVKNVSFTANRGPFSVMIDGTISYNATSELGLTWILVPSLASSETHDFVATGPGGEIVKLLGQAVTQTNNSFLFSFPPTELAVSDVPRYLSPEQASANTVADMERSLRDGRSIVVLVTDPPGASVQAFNGVVGTTPLMLYMSQGYQIILLAHEGFKPQNMSIQAQAGRAYLQKTTLQANRTLVMFENRHKGSVMLDGQWLVDLPTVKGRQVVSGRHQLTILDEKGRIVRQAPVVLDPATVFTVTDSP